MSASNGPAGPTGPPGSAEPAPAIEAPAQLRAGAGGSVTGQVRLTNTASEARVMSLSMHGVDASWLPAASRSRALAPGESIAADITLRPAVGTIAARYPVAIAVQALDPSTGQATSPTALAEVVLVVDAPGEVGITLDPTEARAVFGRRIKVRLRNDGGRPATVDLQAQTPLSARLHLARPQVQVPAGQTVTVTARVRPRRVRLFGGPVRQAFTVTSRSMGAPRHAEGILTSRAMLGSTATKVVALLAIVGLWAGLAVVFIPKLADHLKSGTGTVVAGAGSTAAATATPGPGKGSGSGSGGSGPGSGDSGGARSGGSTSGAKSGNKAKPASAANSVQLNGTVAGTSPSGVTVSLAPTSLVDEAAEAAIPVGLSAQAVDSMRLTGKIPQSALTASSARTSGQHRTVTTSADGAWSFPAVPKPGYYLLTFAKSGYQSVSYVVDSTTASPTKPLNVVMSAGQGQLNGMVTGPGGKRVGGATITITDGTNTITTSTDSTGNVGAWSVVGLSTPSTYLVSATLAGMSTGSRLVPLGAGGAATVNLKLVAGVGAITGTVAALDGSGGLGGVSVSATDGDTVTRTATTVTGGTLRGRYTLSGLTAPGKYTITFTAQGYLIQTVQVTLGKGQASATQNVTLFPSTATVEGIANDASGPLAGAGLILTSSDNTYKTTSGDDGSYRFDGVAPGSYVLSAQYSGLTTVFKSLTVTAGASAPIAVPGFTLTQPPAQTSTATITGFVSDGNNPSNTLCPSTPGHCTVTFTLHDQSGAVVPLVQSSIAAATGGPTSYTLQPASGVSPGLYKLTIGATGYLPTTVTVQLPLSGTATAPAISLYPVNTVNGTITTVGNLASGPVGTGYPTSYTNCVYLVPTGGAAPNTAAACSSSQVPASTCTTTGTAGPAYTVITGDSFGFGNLCDGSYDVYVSIANPWYVAPAPTTITLAHGQTLAVTIAVTRLGQLSLTLQQLPLTGRTPVALPSSTTVTLTCTSSTSAASTFSPTTLTSDGNIATSHAVGGFAPGDWICTGTASGYKTAQTGTLQISNGQVTPATLTFTQKLGVVFGRVTTSWTGSPTGVKSMPSDSVQITGTVGYSGGVAQTDVVTVTPTGTDGCFAITPDGSLAGATVPSDCGDLSPASTAAIATMPLIANTANFVVKPPSNYQDPGTLTETLTSGGLVNLPISPNPVTLVADSFKLVPSGGSLSGFTLNATQKPPDAGTITFSVDTATGVITWQDSKLPAGQIAPGTYTVTATKPHYAQGSVQFTCGIDTACDLSSSPLKVNQDGSLTVNLPTTAAATVTLRSGNAVVNSQDAVNGTVTFSDLDPSVTNYAIDVQAAGYQFGSTDGKGPNAVNNVTLDCGKDTNGNTVTSIAIPAGGTQNCAAALAPDGKITGYVYGVLAASPATTPTQGLAGITVTAKDQATGTEFTATTGSDGKYTITGSATTQGLDPDTWTVSVDGLTGYTPASGTSTDVDVKADALSPTADLYLYVIPVDVTITANDQNGAATPGVKVTLNGVTQDTATSTDSTANPPTTKGATTFDSIIPGSYTVSYSLTGYGSGTQQITVLPTGAAQSFPVQITANATLVDGLVQIVSGPSPGTTGPLTGATVCVSTSNTDCSSPAKGTDGTALSMPTGSDGKFSFSTVPDGNFYIVAVPHKYGYSTVSSAQTSIAYPNPTGGVHLTLEPTQVQNKLTVTVSNSSDEDLTTWSPTLTSADNSSWTPAPDSATHSSSSTDSVFTWNQVPAGCWTFSLSNPSNHYGKLTAGTLPTASGITCTDQIAVSGTASTPASADYTLDEYQAEVKVAPDSNSPLAADPDGAPTTVTLNVTTPGSTYQDTSFPVDTATKLQLWLAPTDTSETASVNLGTTYTAQGWSAPATTAVSLSGTTTISLTEAGATVSVKVTLDGNPLSGSTTATVALNAPTGSTIDAATLTGTAKASSSSIATIAGVPWRDGWTATATITGSSPAETKDSDSFDITDSSPGQITIDITS